MDLAKKWERDSWESGSWTKEVHAKNKTYYRNHNYLLWPRLSWRHYGVVCSCYPVLSSPLYPSPFPECPVSYGLSLSRASHVAIKNREMRPSSNRKSNINYIQAPKTRREADQGGPPCFWGPHKLCSRNNIFITARNTVSIRSQSPRPAQTSVATLPWPNRKQVFPNLLAWPADGPPLWVIISIPPTPLDSTGLLPSWRNDY